MKDFEPVPSPFGTGIDEQATTDAFVDYVGGRERAERLSYLWNNSYPGIKQHLFDVPTKRQAFERKAFDEGFTIQQVEAFFSL